MAFRIACFILLATPPAALSLPIPGKSQVGARQNNPLNGLLGLVTSLPGADVLVDGAAQVLTGLQGDVVAPLLNVGPENQTDITANKPCADMTLIFARGTTEPGNMGTLVGPQLVDEIKKAMPAGRTLNVQGVDYGATIQGYLGGGGADGTASM